MVGQSAGNYRLTRRIGQGGMGAVYVGEHPVIGRRVAVKVLLPERARDQEMVGRFFNEARAASAIHHPGIVEVLDFGTLPSGVPYIVMELLEGESLTARIERDGRLEPQVAVDLGVQAASALGAAHAQGIVHRDLKPDNLFLVEDPQGAGRARIKILDFGIAKLTGGAESELPSVRTRTGAILGTPIYMSPEQCRGGRAVDHRADQYALGVILFEMVCGTPPFGSSIPGDLIHSHITERPPSPRLRNPEVSPALDATILRALEKDPGQRFQNMAELAEALRIRPARDAGAPRVGRDSPTVVAPIRSAPARPTPARPPPARSRTPVVAPPRRRFRVLPLAVGVLVLAAAGGVVAVAVRPWKQSAPAHVEEPASPARSVPAPAAASERPASAAPVPAAPVPPAPEPPSPRSVSVRVTSRPAGARLTRESDGAILGVTPFEGSLPARPGRDRLKVDRAGYVVERVVFPLDEDVDLTVSLEPSTSLRKAQAPVPSPVRGGGLGKGQASRDATP